MTSRTFTLSQAPGNVCPFCGTKLERLPGPQHPRHGQSVDFTKPRGEQADVLFRCKEKEESTGPASNA